MPYTVILLTLNRYRYINTSVWLHSSYYFLFCQNFLLMCIFIIVYFITQSHLFVITLLLHDVLGSLQVQQIRFLSHWNPYAVLSLEVVACKSCCNTLEWFWWDCSLSQWPTGFLQCFDAVGWVIWPVKIVAEMTCNVSSETLSLCTHTLCDKLVWFITRPLRMYTCTCMSILHWLWYDGIWFGLCFHLLQIHCCKHCCVICCVDFQNGIQTVGLGKRNHPYTDVKAVRLLHYEKYS